jgi:hypothetical protein
MHARVQFCGLDREHRTEAVGFNSLDERHTKVNYFRCQGYFIGSGYLGPKGANFRPNTKMATQFLHSNF